MSGALKAKIIVVVVLLALTAALVGTCIAYRNRACEHTSLEHIEAVEPTCTESGNIEHWACKRCGATFKDESGAEEIGRVVRTALGHDLTRHSAVEPTCTEAGNVEYWECDRCRVIFADSAATKPLDDHIVAASGHDWNEPVWDWSDDYSKAAAYFVCNKDSEHVESVTAKVTISSASATCTGSGRITYLAKAELDGKTYSDSEVVQSGALGHDWTVSEWIWADDHTSVTAKFVCSRDPSHTHEVTETEIVINEDPATCEKEGKTEYSAEIAFDGNTYSDTAVVTLPATGHNWGEPEWTWNGDYSEATATFTCLNDPSHTETVNAVVSILSSSATCTEPGNTEYKAELSFNENVYTDSQSVSGEALGHNWAVSEWIWSKDYTSVTAKFVCSRDPSHTDSVTATDTDIDINEVSATCEKEGKTEYSVEIAFDGNTYSATAVVTHPATGHNWSAPEWTWSEDSSEATATFTCQNDPSHTETLAAEVTIVDTTATCTAPGETGFMAKVTFNGKDYTDKQTVTGEALGHAWAVSEWIWSDDYTSVTAKFVCSRDNSHTRAVSGQINEDVIKPVSCTEDGESTFTATVSLDDETYTDQKASVVVKAKGHVLSKNWSFDDVYHWHECTVCGEKRDLSKHELVDFICSVCNHTIIYTAGLEYTLSGDGESYLVSGIGTATDKDIKIMPRYDGKPVTGIADNALEHKSINSVLIPDGVESIGAYAFRGCGDLTKVVIPGSVKSIGIYAFDNCRRITRIDYSGDITGWLNIEGLNYLMSDVSSSLELYIGGIKVEELVIPDGVTSIPSCAFRNMTGITSVTIPDSVTSIGTSAFSGCTAEIVWGDEPVITEIGDYAFAGYNGTSFVIPDSVTSIGSYAFSGCSGLKTVTIGNGVTSIGDNAFSGCSSLTSVTIPDSVTSIGWNAFYGCSSLQSLTIGNGVTSIGIRAFYKCTGLTEINWNAVSVADFNSKDNVFYNAGTAGDGIEVTFGESVEKLPACLFDENDSSYRPNIKSVTIGNAVNSIGSSAFYDCRSITRIDYSGDISGWLKISGLYNLMNYVSSSCELYLDGIKVEGDIIIPDGVTSISCAFANLSAITSVTIPDSVKSIGTSAFSGCSGLQTVTIGNGVTSIGNYAFEYCSSLTEVTIPDSVTSIGRYAFSHCSGLTEVTIPDSVTSIREDAFEGCINLIQKDNGVSYVDKWVVDRDSSVTAANIRSDTVGIADRAFYACRYLKTVVIPDSVTSIGQSAFYGCSRLTSVTIPDSVTSIGSWAFENCSGLKSVTIGNGVTSIGGSAFGGCSGITRIDYSGDITGWLNIEGLDNLMEYVSSSCELYFGGTKVEELVIPDGVTSIPSYAFRNMTGITSVTIPDSVTIIGSYAFYNCSGLQSLTIGTGVTSIEDDAFSGCPALSTLNWNAVNVSGFDSSNNVFNSAGTGGNGISVTFGDSVESIPSYLFYSNYSSYITPKITKITIGNNVKSIGSHAFRSVSSVSSVIIPVSVESIGEYAFNDIDTIYCEAQSMPTNWSSDWADSSIKVIWGYNNQDSGEFSYVVKDNKAYLTKYKGSGAEVTIPDTLSGYQVVSFGEIFKNNTNITKVVIGNNVTSVFPYAFYGCSSLTSVTIPDSVTSIGTYAFYNCSSLTSVTIPDSVTSIEMSVFSGCSGLTSITIPDSVTSIGSSAFSGCSSLTSLTIPDSVTSIVWDAFSGCSGLQSVTIGTGVTSIGDDAFRNCSGLTSVTIGNGVTSIGEYAFGGCSSLTSVTIGTGVTSIGQSAFINCSSITRVDYSGDISCWLNIEGHNNLMSYVSSSCELYLSGTKVEELFIPDGVTSIPSAAFQNLKGITSVTIPDSVTSIGEHAFSGCSGLQSVTIGNGVTSIVSYVFSGCSSLKTVTIGNGVTSIGIWAFSGCSNITRVDYAGDITGWMKIRSLEGLMNYVSSSCELYIGGTKVEGDIIIPEGVTSIPSYAFRYQTGITSVTIPDSVTSIGERAFSGCSGLTSVTIGNGVTSIGQYAFSSCSSLTSVTIPDSVTSIGYRAFYGCSGITRIDYSGDISGWLNIRGLNYLMSDVSSSCELYFGGTKVEELVIPDGVTSIQSCAFRNLKGITSVTIPDSVTSIGQDAFYGCSSLTSVIIPDSVTSIGDSAFSGCSGLTSVTIGNGVTSIGRYAFQYCSSLQSVTIGTGVTSIEQNAFYGCSSLTSITIPDSVTSIGDSAFSGCSSLTSVTIPDSVTSIGSSAFRDCSSLTSVTIPDSVTSIGQYAFMGCSGITRIDYSGDISGWLNIDGLEYLMYYVSSSLEMYIGGTKVEGDINIPEGVTSIQDSAFRYQTGITSVTIPDSVTSIGSSAFSGCSGLQSVTIGNGVTSIGSSAFYNCSSLTSLKIPDSVTSIGGYAFKNCSSLTSVTIPDSVTSIGDDAFRGCSGLTSVTIGNGVTSIGQLAFSGCTALSTLNWNAVDVSGFNSPNNVFSGAGTDGYGISVTFGDSVESIPGYLFYASNSNYPKIAGIKIGNSVKSIGSNAFRSDSSVSSVIIPASVESMGANAFNDIDTIYCEAQSKPTNWSNNWANSFINVIWGYNNKTDSSEFDYVVRDNKAYLTKYKGSGAEVTIPDTLSGYKVVGFGEIFKFNTNITKVVIGNNVTSVFPYAFYGCKRLTSVTIPDSVTSIGQYAFSICDSLTSATFKNTSGWYAGSTWLRSGSLANESTAAQYLRSTYVTYTWTRR